LRLFALAGSVNQNPPHRLGCGGEEMAAIGEFLRARRASKGISFTRARATGSNQSHVRLMHQRRGVERLARPFMRELGGGELAQFLVDQRQKLLGGTRIAGIDGI
jgi:hypothetical protein